MTTFQVKDLTTRGGDGGAILASLVEVLGKEEFGPALANFLYALCGADHFAAFRLGSVELTEVAACCVEPERTARAQVETYLNKGWWRRDPAMSEAQRCLLRKGSNIIHLDLRDHGYSAMRSSVYPHVRDRLLLCGRRADAAFGLSVLRSDAHPPFTDQAIELLRQSAELLVAVLAKHDEVCLGQPNMAQALTALAEIEKCIAAIDELPRREAEVCARVLYGKSSLGIALDLALSEETVKTYRKRAYQRLAIGSKRELLTWYLARWSLWRGYR